MIFTEKHPNGVCLVAQRWLIVSWSLVSRLRRMSTVIKWMKCWGYLGLSGREWSTKSGQFFCKIESLITRRTNSSAARTEKFLPASVFIRSCTYWLTLLPDSAPHLVSKKWRSEWSEVASNPSTVWKIPFAALSTISLHASLLLA